MEITNSNAVALLPYVGTLLRDCSFFAVDLEFSGIDHDGAEADAETPEQALHSLTRKPSDLYPAKLQAIKPYSMVQIGISVFTELVPGDAEGATSASGAASLTAPSSAAAHLRKEVAEFLAADVANRTTYAETTTVVERMLTSANGAAAGFTSAFKYITEQMVAVAQSLEVVARASDIRATAEPAPPIQSLPGLRYHYRFLEALSRAVASYRREITATGAPAFEAPVARYKVHTFSALTFPAATDSAADVTLNIDTAEFLVKNDMDLTRWVKEGLRFAPIKVAAAQLAKEAEAKLQQMNLLAQPHTVLPGYKECIGRKLDELLPLSPGELQLVRFVIALPDAGSGDMAAARVKQFYVGALRPLISFARGNVPESALPESIYTRDKLFKDEMDALAAIGMTKMSRKFMRAAISSSWGSRCGSSLVSHSYGSALLETLLYATEVQRKPIVFYNGYTDVMFLLLALYGPQNMPPDLPSFKSLVRRHFPSLFDTRILSCAGPLQGLGNFTGKLSSVVDEMSKVSSIGPHVSFIFDPLVSGGRDATQHLLAHNAAFDALLTGKLFAFAKCGLENANVSVKVYENFLATYTTLMSINLQGSVDSVLQEATANVYYLTKKSGLRADTIREALAGCGITAVVMYRGSGYTIQPVGAACQMPDLMQVMREALCARARSQIELYHIAL
ncbi:ribonuclease, putative [Leishmania donovani]|uniref:CAF1 ribonuclease family protein n=1 Tax=Leishmania donovani TaxID=5661 RepID=A0A3S7X9D8_LEIDO|nr:ribonuclease, putative [Leishmania donovani]AYU83038.1 poly(A)-specific ribonuclease PARN, putative [Leishmania donovani]TPP44505.1 CAF1 ribonuclease family protein [Leishmania donovani]CBZ38138.1 ribonuclease, putative [Leishmania donovani]